MRIEPSRMAALLLALAALAGCGIQWPKVGVKPEEQAFADADARCTQLAMKAAPINEARVIDCDGDRNASNVHCGTRSELKTTLKLPAPAEAEAVRETNIARRQAYTECMAKSGT